MGHLDDDTYLAADKSYSEDVKPTEGKYKLQIVWRNVILFSLLHFGAVIGLYQLLFVCQWKTFIWTFVLYYISGCMGITAGAHRLWAHRSYKAKTPLRVILMLANCVAVQNDIIEWVRDHRGHHKWSDTNADPHNASRGFFFTHMGWLLCRKHPSVMEKGKTLDISDVLNDPVCVFQRKHYRLLVLLLCFIMPTVVPVVFWSEQALVAFYTAAVFRLTVVLHATWMVNSVAHMFGDRPYDTNIKPRQSIWTSWFAMGEGWHNYHHVFPFDYKAAELPYVFNLTTVFIDAFALIGWVYDRKTASHDMITQKRQRTGEQCIKQG